MTAETEIEGPRTFRDILLEVRDSVAEIKTDMTTIRRVVFGNEDRVGLVSRVSALEERMRMIGWLGAAVGVLVLGLLFEIFTGKVSVVFH